MRQFCTLSISIEVKGEFFPGLLKGYRNDTVDRVLSGWRKYGKVWPARTLDAMKHYVIVL